MTYGFGRSITFPEHDSLLVNQTTTAQFDVVTIAGARQSQYRAPLEGFPTLPSWIKALRLPSGLCLRLLRSLLYFGSEVKKFDRFQPYVNRLTYVVRLEVARSIANALDLDFRFSHIVWIVSDEMLALLREFPKTSKVEMPAQGSAPACLRGIDDVEAACRAARSLGHEYLFERFHITSGGCIR